MQNQAQIQVVPQKERSILAKSFFSLVEHWGLTHKEQAQLLGWDYENKRTKMDSMRKGQSVLESDVDKIERIVDLVNIHKCLRILFPYDRQAVYAWVKVSRERFGGHCALDIMLAEGRFGIAAIRHYLEDERTR